MENKRDQKNKSSTDIEALPAKFFKTVEKQLSDYPQVGAIILDGLAVACSRVAELLDGFSEQLEERCEELKKTVETNKSNKASRQSNYSRSSQKPTAQGASAH